MWPAEKKARQNKQRALSKLAGGARIASVEVAGPSYRITRQPASPAPNYEGLLCANYMTALAQLNGRSISFGCNAENDTLERKAAAR